MQTRSSSYQIHAKSGIHYNCYQIDDAEQLPSYLLDATPSRKFKMQQSVSRIPIPDKNPQFMESIMPTPLETMRRIAKSSPIVVDPRLSPEYNSKGYWNSKSMDFTSPISRDEKPLKMSVNRSPSLQEELEKATLNLESFSNSPIDNDIPFVPIDNWKTHSEECLVPSPVEKPRERIIEAKDMLKSVGKQPENTNEKSTSKSTNFSSYLFFFVFAVFCFTAGLFADILMRYYMHRYSNSNQYHVPSDENTFVVIDQYYSFLKSFLEKIMAIFLTWNDAQPA
ncbi:hypothetical protein O9G_004432 [Rozella allomycis CSF55]|uniref:Uncharacterized protein n=1 Tax=Rozella allomycis (strain CSF55) TaxID=988480 RepID=A0A075AZ02_ROZAC|nr:hypothetical protein O9G_004432 [Rozella allomycis CSF55]|eukprot:EPZ33784.1 hypothetical protein O9G_004432 [Rozella allomycis CSF55]